MPLQLKQEFIDKIIADQILQGTIAKATGKDVSAPLRWAKRGSHEKLTMLSTLVAIRSYLGLDKTEELTEEAELINAA